MASWALVPVSCEACHCKSICICSMVRMQVGQNCLLLRVKSTGFTGRRFPKWGRGRGWEGRFVAETSSTRYVCFRAWHFRHHQIWFSWILHFYNTRGSRKTDRNKEDESEAPTTWTVLPCFLQQHLIWKPLNHRLLPGILIQSWYISIRDPWHRHSMGRLNSEQHRCTLEAPTA